MDVCECRPGAIHTLFIVCWLLIQNMLNSVIPSSFYVAIKTHLILEILSLFNVCFLSLLFA